MKLPARSDLTSWFPKAGAQGDRNSCTGWAVGYALRSFQENRRSLQRTDRDSVASLVAYSPAFVYNYTMQYLSQGDCDQGTDLIHALTVAVDNGVCRWTTMPYDSALTACQDSIPSQAFSEATQHRMRDPLGLELGNRGSGSTTCSREAHRGGAQHRCLVHEPGPRRGRSGEGLRLGRAGHPGPGPAHRGARVDLRGL
ncbi:MAG: hypothetical protein IPO79_10495 [Flavobacteriales bacterium]|nr:hypothetical protein [Flavobacteriales bacterium]